MILLCSLYTRSSKAVARSSSPFGTSLAKAKALRAAMEERDMPRKTHQRTSTENPDSEKTGSKEPSRQSKSSLEDDCPQARRMDLMIWMGIGGGLTLLTGAAVLNGGLGVLDALWQLLMGGTAGIVYSWSGGETPDRTSSEGAFFPKRLKKLLRGRWPPKKTAAMFLAGACLTPIIAEGVTPVADLGNGALMTIPSVLIGMLLGGIGYAFNHTPVRMRPTEPAGSFPPSKKCSLKRTVQPIRPDRTREDERRVTNKVNSLIKICRE